MLVVLFPSVSIGQTTITIPAIRDCVNCPGNPSTNGTGVVSAYTCNTASAGTLTVGTAVSGVTQTITATVTTVGTYNISAIANGVTFAATGTFTATGSQPIVLTATGTPITNNTSTFVLNTTPNCYFNRAINGLGGPSPSGSCPSNLKFQYVLGNYWGLTVDGDVYGWDDALEGTLRSKANAIPLKPLNYGRCKTPSKVQFLPKIKKIETTPVRVFTSLYPTEIVALGFDGNIYNLTAIPSPDLTVLGNASTGLVPPGYATNNTIKTTRLPAPPTGSSWADVGGRLNPSQNSIATKSNFIFAINNLGELYYLSEPPFTSGTYPEASTWTSIPYPQGVAASFRYTEILRSEVTHERPAPAVLKGNDGFYYSFIGTPGNATSGLLCWGIPQSDSGPLISSLPAVNSSQIGKMQFPAGTVLERMASDVYSPIVYYFTTDGQLYVTGQVGGASSADPAAVTYDFILENYTDVDFLVGAIIVAYTKVPKKIALPAGATRFYSYNLHMAVTDIGTFNATTTYFTTKDNDYFGLYGTGPAEVPFTYQGVKVNGHLWTPVLPINDFSAYGKKVYHSYVTTTQPGIIHDGSFEKFMLLGDDGTLYRIDKPGRMQYLINGNCDASNGFPEP
ncbi:MAG: hypothetical protein ACK4YV_07910 [Emticicia sp.]